MEEPSSTTGASARNKNRTHDRLACLERRRRKDERARARSPSPIEVEAAEIDRDGHDLWTIRRINLIEGKGRHTKYHVEWQAGGYETLTRDKIAPLNGKYPAIDDYHKWVKREKYKQETCGSGRPQRPIQITYPVKKRDYKIVLAHQARLDKNKQARKETTHD
ncbi:Hypothetical predicted protein [Olea europaea subsp. europaea]|uniref:Chromo domain-containing protein n=1 Tax=Olea europaea subsp. europaea TaxID=158383 RepID=A0A8S0UGS4_OLEEU|nr:Hypothetical predicted protein [Olea europaea subsp. europaea]